MLTVLPCWQGCTQLGLARVQQVAAAVVHREAQEHPMAPAHSLAPLHALPSEQEERMADPAPGKHSDAVSEAQVGMLSASQLATCLSPETVRSLPCRAALGYAGMPQISGLHLVEVHSRKYLCKEIH